MKIEHLYDEETGKPVNMKHAELDRSMLQKVGRFGYKDDGDLYVYDVYVHRKGEHPFPKKRGSRKEVWSGERLPFDPSEPGEMFHSLHSNHGSGHFKVTAYGGNKESSPVLEHDFIWIEKVRPR